MDMQLSLWRSPGGEKLRPPANSCGNVASGEWIDPLATIKPAVPTDVANTLTQSRKPPVNFLPNAYPTETVQ